jgi:hypothetical protein
MNGAVTGQLAVGSRRGSIPFSWVGLFQEKTEQNQSRIFVLVPKGGRNQNCSINSLSYPWKDGPVPALTRRDGADCHKPSGTFVDIIALANWRAI